jgi:hypothetical protein
VPIRAEITGSSASERIVADRRQFIRAEIWNSSTASALGVTAHGDVPVLSLCRALIRAGHDPALPLHAYRQKNGFRPETILCLTVRSIGEAARLEVNSRGTAFVRHRPRRRAAPPIAFREAAE